MYMASTLNGFIAKENDDTSWISNEEWDSYSARIRKAGNLIVGRRTYYILTKQPEYSELKDVKLVVVSHQDIQKVDRDHIVVTTPRESLEILKDYEEVVIAGGGILNASFVEENLVDEIYIDIEPILFGKGIILFNGEDCERRLKLIDIKKITKNEVQLHYLVEN